MIVTTMNDIPGYEVDEVFGEVFGLTVRSRNIGSQFGASLKSILGGELKGMTKALVDSRHEVMARMIAEAEAKPRSGRSAHNRQSLHAKKEGSHRGTMGSPMPCGHARRCRTRRSRSSSGPSRTCRSASQ
jgi:hypothetical protein